MILIGKEIIMPMIGLGVVWVFFSYNIIDRVLAIIILVTYASPSSLQLLMICTAHQTQVDNISKVYLIMYGTTAIPMTLWTMGFLILLY